jgi:hypothetical protein
MGNESPKIKMTNAGQFQIISMPHSYMLLKDLKCIVHVTDYRI